MLLLIIVMSIHKLGCYNFYNLVAKLQLQMPLYTDKATIKVNPLAVYVAFSPDKLDAR